MKTRVHVSQPTAVRVRAPRARGWTGKTVGIADAAKNTDSSGASMTVSPTSPTCAIAPRTSGCRHGQHQQHEAQLPAP